MSVHMFNLVFHLVVGHNVTGEEIFINPYMVETLRSIPKEADYLKDGIQCVIQMSNGKNTLVIESCAEMKEGIESARKENEK